jgi:hypothetical protein
VSTIALLPTADGEAEVIVIDEKFTAPMGARI